ncbi:ATP synthase subunit E [Sulfitobacter noctilucae]|uniref:hypothetical protein n=1 Tax=Sulfitobacter noctilucae TaxID=1342302 RepID=UPI00046881ED|nr:hypothetical protein [Sulfitobacter noctilucae]KIN61409.1 ATP synthase subunit E [Sulfitobacter noctilucae]
MTQEQNGLGCTGKCWLIAGAVGFVTMALLYFFSGFGGIQAFSTGVIVALVLGFVLNLFVCRGQAAAVEEMPAQRSAREAEVNTAGRSSAATTAASSPAAATAAPVAAAADATPAAHASTAPAASAAPEVAVAAPVQKSHAIKPSKPLAGQAELASRKGDWKYENPTKDTAKPAAEKAPAKKAAAPVAADKKSEAIPAGETAAPAAKPEKKAVVASSGTVIEEAPQLFDAAPAEGADDLKLISGVGPKLEQTLNDLGIYRFDQVATWGESEIAWVDARLRFKGRIIRDDWMSQAKTLAEGGETASSRKKK